MNAKTVRRSFATLAIAVVTGITGLAVASPASAAAQDGIHPKNSMCIKDRKVVKAANMCGANHLKLGKVELSTPRRTGLRGPGPRL